ncbi:MULTISPECIES: hypothetical protein [Pseudomonas]|uniref:hypothetical protein n=1 Tax=Pseudomonas TaxID=286 RepID=UPI001C2F3D3F|nr:MULTISPECIES: hypothetical protein [Pseudomonas]MBV2080031.1 hypothetical protein [Pseudomonas carnis]MBV2085961.1 hypothetical protein [Pseudomonas carnis]MDO7032857.1 hypothetical protein [Pseudomonas sp. DKN 2792]
MVFDPYVLLNGIWGYVCVSVMLPAFVTRNDRSLVSVAALIFVVNSPFLYFSQRMLITDALMRSATVALINLVMAYLTAHFFHHRRSVLDLFRHEKRL